MRRRSWLIAGLLLICGLGAVWAQSDVTSKFKVESSLRFDNNLFRLPPDADTEALIGKPSAAERIDINSLNLNFSSTLSLQKFEVAINLVNYRYQNFDYLSYPARNYNAVWHWALTPRLHGNLGSQRQETQNNFADTPGRYQQNLRVNNNTRFDTALEPGGGWSVLAGVSQSTQTNQLAVTADADYEDKSVDLGFSYVLGSGNTIGYTRRKVEGRYLHHLLASGLYDEGFQQIDNEIKLHWLITGKSALDLKATHISRTHPQYADGDYSGVNASANFSWTISGKSALTASWTRELASYQTLYSSYSLTDRYSLGQFWQISPKLLLRARYELARTEYLGAPFGLIATPRSDSSTDASISFDWQPNQYITISTSLENATRKSNYAVLDYESKMATVSAQFSY
ncbi:MAG: XrtB/PEP-CTERM-associated polysaccharide biosynthesis outer membrane protein EpsL [Rhodoferax sp.]